MTRRRLAFVLLTLWLPACGGTRVVDPVPLAGGEACEYCRMTVEDPTLAAQVVGPGEEPRYFDDIGCVAAFLKEQRTRPVGQVVYVADHRTKQWVRADEAVFTRVERLSTPMDSHLVAHSDVQSRDADPDARGGSPVPAREIVGADARGGV